jgi:DnaJ-class molecular chaperone
MSFDKEMQKALEADGDKLHQLTGADHGPYFLDDWEACEACGGDGEILKYKPQPDDPEFATVHQCDACGGSGWVCAFIGNK